MIRRPPRFTLTSPPFPSTTLFRSLPAPDRRARLFPAESPLRQGNRPRATQAWTLRAGDWVRSWSGSPKLFAGRRLEAAAQQGLCLVCVAEAGQQDRRLAGRILLVDAEKCQQPIPVARGKIGHRFHRLIALVDLRDRNRDDLVVGVRPRSEAHTS